MTEKLRFEGVLVRRGAMERVVELMRKVAATNATVLITGESGTGKELMARALYANSRRKDRAFVSVNCGAIPEGLMESALFGHVRGAFTGACSSQRGYFRQAHGGTLFLDEVGELPCHLQVKLLRVLQERTFIPVGDSQEVSVDVRVIAASNRDLEGEVERGRFRRDLYYRLNVVHLIVPPLRERIEDIPALTKHLIDKYAKAEGKPVRDISNTALGLLMKHDYRGNIRELENIVAHSLAVTNGEVLTEADLPDYVRGKGSPLTEPIGTAHRIIDPSPAQDAGIESFFEHWVQNQDSLDDVLESLERWMLLGALKKSTGVQKKAARILGINYRSFRHRLEKYGLIRDKLYLKQMYSP